MNYKIWNEQKCEEIMVDEDRLEGVETKYASKIIYDGIDRVYVIYREGSKYEKHVAYKRYFGNWGFPTTLV